MTENTAHNLISVYENAYINECNLTASAPLTREALLERLTTAQINALYREYFASLETEISRLKQQGAPTAKPAEDLLAEIKTSFNGESKKCLGLEDLTLLEVLHHTDQLLKTPYLDSHSQVNPRLTTCVENLNRSLNSIKKDARCAILVGAGMLLGALAIIGTVIAGSILTFGAAAAAHKVTVRTIYSLVFQGTVGLCGLSIGALPFGLFGEAYKLNKLAGKMEPLIAASNKP